MAGPPRPELPRPTLPARARFDPALSATLERLAARAWPAERVEEIAGWQLRQTPTVDRRRSNTLLPPLDDARALAGLDAALERAAELGMTPAVQVSPLEAHPRLDAELSSRGFAVSGPALVLCGPPPPTTPRDGADSATGQGLIALGEPGDAWLRAWVAAGAGPGAAETARVVLSQLGERGRFAVARDAGGAPAAVGIGVAEEGWLGLFSLLVAPGARRRGLATAVVGALTDWGTARGAQRVYLQVETDNLPALTFYGRLGFTIAHRYHHRVLRR